MTHPASSPTARTAPLAIVILAAGKGTRMCSREPKVLQTIAGRSMLDRVINTARTLTPTRIHVVIGHDAERVAASVSGDDIGLIEQRPQLGTGHALQVALPALPASGQTLVLYGDVPLIDAATLNQLIANTAADSLGLLTDTLSDPTGYGRIVRNDAGSICAIVEEKDASADQRRISEINTGIMLLPNRFLPQWLAALQTANAQGEYYLTDLVAMAVAAGAAVCSTRVAASHLAAGVNDRLQQAALERICQRQQAHALMRAGLILRDPERFDLRGELEHGKDVSIDVGVVLEGHCQLGDGVQIGAHCVLRNVTLAAGVRIAAFSHLEDCHVGANSRIGPYARLRPGAELANDVRIGNFVEIKAAHLQSAVKVNHLSYVGDATIGSGSNLGAGVVTCNYDGTAKHQTRIGNDCFIGSGALLIAPRTIGNAATIAAGSVITRDCADNTLAIERSPQRSIANWPRRAKKT